MLLLVLAFRTIRGPFTEHITLWGAFHYLGLRASILPGNRAAPECYRDPWKLMKVLRTLSLSPHLTFSHAIPSQASVSPSARSYFRGRLSRCQGLR